MCIIIIYKIKTFNHEQITNFVGRTAQRAKYTFI